MRVRFITTCALGLAAALTLEAVPLAAQQDTIRLRRTTRSTQRIPITKEAPGEVVTVRVDTVYVTRHDTVTNTILRIDTVVVTPPPPPVRALVREWYWGLLAGASFPTGDFDDLYTNGYNLGALVGWDQPDGYFGFRLQGLVNQVGREQFLFDFDGNGIINDLDNRNFFIGDDAPMIWSLGLNGKARAPLGGWSPYITGGVNWEATRRIALRSKFDDNCDFLVGNNCFQAAGSNNWRNSFGWNAGVGTDFHIGSQDMFIEGRYVAIRRNGENNGYVPVSLGVRFF